MRSMIIVCGGRERLLQLVADIVYFEPQLADIDSINRDNKY